MKETNAAAAGSQPSRSDRYFAISPAVICPETTAEFRVYLKHDQRYVLYTKERERYTPALKQKLVDNGIDRVYVPIAQRELYEAYLLRNLGSILTDAAIPLRERSKVFLDTSMRLVKDIFDSKLPDGLTQEMYDQIHYLVTSSLHFLSLEEAVRHVGSLISHDYQTFSHSVHVFTYSMSILHSCSLNEHELIDAGIGALLHDIGKTRIPRRILNKPGKLDPDEWAYVQQHPVFGVSLCSKIPLAHTSIKAILFHHEKFNGTGYPAGMKGGDIPWPVRVITVCDVYDAITSKRPYAKGETPFQALGIMKNEMQDALDMDIFKHLVYLLSQGAVAQQSVGA